jgi:hypothetical protein
MLIGAVDKKQKEALVMALLEKGETYREITKKAGVSPNTIKAIANKAGLSKITSESSRAFELYVQQKTPLEVAIELNLEADKAIHYYHDYFKLLGITEFTRVYLLVKDNPMAFVNLFELCQNSNTTEILCGVLILATIPVDSTISTMLTQQFIGSSEKRSSSPCSQVCHVSLKEIPK